MFHLKMYVIVLTVLASWLFSTLVFEPVNNIRMFNLLTESFTAMMAAFFYLKVDALKNKPYHSYLSWGFYLAFVALCADSFDQLYLHNELYTAVVEKTMKLVGYALVFVGVKKWLKEYHDLNIQLSKQAHTDDLTGLYNRRGMQQQLELIHNKAIKESSSYCVIVIDFDDFKVINDTYGHVAGDDVLRTVGNAIFAFLNESQKIGRWGGEEFAVVEFGVTSKQAEQTCENIKAHLSQLVMPGSIENHRVTLSFGVSQLIGNETNLEVVKRADRALYQSKTAGKNCVTVL